MLLTPPDVISQTLLAIPMWILFELGLVFSRFYAKPEEEENSIGGDTAPVSPPTAKEAAATATPTSTTATAGSHVEPAADPLKQSEARSGDTGYGDSADHDDANDSGHGEYEPPTEAELDAELDRLEAEENAEEAMPNEQNTTEDAQGNEQTKPGNDK
jgi:sec-independent protein translocase protein TatC